MPYKIIVPLNRIDPITIAIIIMMMIIFDFDEEGANEGVVEVGAIVEEAVDGDEMGVLVDGKQVGKRDAEGANEGDVLGEAAVDVKVSTIAPFPPGD